MGVYNVNRKQDLTGIATLTNDPIAVDNIIRERAEWVEKIIERDADHTVRVTEKSIADLKQLLSE